MQKKHLNSVDVCPVITFPVTFSVVSGKHFKNESESSIFNGSKLSLLSIPCYYKFLNFGFFYKSYFQTHFVYQIVKFKSKI